MDVDVPDRRRGLRGQNERRWCESLLRAVEIPAFARLFSQTQKRPGRMSMSSECRVVERVTTYRGEEMYRSRQTTHVIASSQPTSFSSEHEGRSSSR